MRNALALLFPVLILLHLLAAPYTKVEESFHVQAIHDIQAHGLPEFPGKESLNISRTQYDHFAFPGAVPRTAIGAVVLAKLSQPVARWSMKMATHCTSRKLSTPVPWITDEMIELGCNRLLQLATWLNQGIGRQILARAVLGLMNALALGFYAHGVRRSFGQVVATWYIILQASQFHLIYYASRPLSNMFAFSLTTVAMRYLLPAPVPAQQDRARCRLSLFLLTVAGVVFRSELALLVATQTLFLLFTGRIQLIKDAVYAGLAGLMVGVMASVYIDTRFWQRTIWPELEAFLFNVISGQSSAWGTEPWYFYFVNALPRLLLNPLAYLVAIPVALRQHATRPAAAGLLAPCLAFVAVYSLQPHKEWRFIIYTIPPLTAAAAQGAAYLWTHRTRSVFARLSTLLLALSTVAAFLISTLVLLPASAANYPGAHALNALHHYHSFSKPLQTQTYSSIPVHLGNLATQTGVTRFLYQHPFTYDKTEDELSKSEPVFWDRFDYVVLEASTDAAFQDGDEKLMRKSLPHAHWETVAVVEGFAGVSVVRPGAPATGTIERRVLRALVSGGGGGGDGGEDAVVKMFETAREVVRHRFLRGWWVEVKTKPRIKVLERRRDHLDY